MALVPSENATGVLARVGPFADYLTGELGVKVDAAHCKRLHGSNRGPKESPDPYRAVRAGLLCTG